MMGTKEETAAKRLERMAREILEAAGSGDEATERLRRRIASDRGLRDHVLTLAARTAVLDAQRAERARIAGNSSHPPPRVYGEELVESVAESCRRLLDWPMRDGTKLADADRRRVLHDAERYAANARGNAVRGKFLELVAAGMGDRGTVADVYGAEDLERLMRQAEASRWEISLVP